MKLTLNGKEYGLFWSVGARCKFDNWVVQNMKASMTEGYIMKALAMIDAYNKANGQENTITKEEIFNLPNREFEALIKAVEEQEKADSTVTVEAEEEKSKKDKSAGSR